MCINNPTVAIKRPEGLAHFPVARKKINIARKTATFLSISVRKKGKGRRDVCASRAAGMTFGLSERGERKGIPSLPAGTEMRGAEKIRNGVGESLCVHIGLSLLLL